VWVQSIRQEAESLLSEDTEVPWLQLKQVFAAVRCDDEELLGCGPSGIAGGGCDALRRQRQSHGEQGWLHEVCTGSGLVLRPIKARMRSPALKAHLASLQKRLEQQQYDAMVHDVTQAV
jgi:hypothetical protein